MSQQHLEFNQPQSTDEREASYTAGYQQEQELYPGGYATSSQGQKLSQHGGTAGPTSAQRLALAIVSLSLFVFVFTVVLIVSLVVPSESLKQISPVMGMFGMAFIGLLIVVNVLFNRKH